MGAFVESGGPVNLKSGHACSVLLLLMLCAVGYGAANCTESTFLECTAGMGSFSNNPGVQGVHYTEDELLTVCRSFDDAKECLKPLKAHCNQNDLSHLAMFEAVFDHLCGEGFDPFIKHSKCTSNYTLDADLEECDATYQAKIDALTNSKEDRKVKVQQLCTHTKRFIVCAGDAVKEVCGDEAAEFLMEMRKVSFHVSMKSYGCNIREKDKNSSSTNAYNLYVVMAVLILTLHL